MPAALRFAFPVDPQQNTLIGPALIKQGTARSPKWNWEMPDTVAIIKSERFAIPGKVLNKAEQSRYNKIIQTCR